MKTSELIKFFENECYETMFDAYCDKGILFLNENHEVLLYILEGDRIDTDYSAFSDLDQSKKQKYYQVIFEYLMTPIEEREEEKKYYLRQIGIGSWSFLNFNINSQEYTVSGKGNNYPYKTQFTQEEINNMPECYTHPAVWEQVEVESEEEC